MKDFSILVVDDDVEFLNSLSEILRANDWHVDVADSGTRAIEMVKIKEYNIALVDVNMPGVDGIETMKVIKKLRPDMVVMMVTGQPVEKLSGLMEQGVSAILPKPVNGVDIITLLSDLEKQKSDDLVLVVEDDEGARVMLSEILMKKGYDVVMAKTGMEAIDCVKKNNMDVVLLDIKLPDMDGVTVLEKIKEIRPSVGIIAITGYSIDSAIENIVRKGAYTCFLKPFDVEVLLNDINFIIENMNKKANEPIKKAGFPEILIVEDNEDIRVSMQEVLDSQGYVSKTAGSVPEAEKLIEETGFDLVLSDLSLGGLSGLVLAEQVKNKNRFASFIVMTGYANIDTALESIKKDVDEYLIKPVRPQDLIKKVETYLGQSRMRMEREKLIESLQETNAKLIELNNIDELTGAYNRKYFFEQLHVEMQRAVRQGGSVCLIFCDIEEFRKYNEKYGAVVADKLLKEVAGGLKSSVRNFVDRLFRYGGDRFALIIPGVKKTNAQKLGDRIVKRVADLVQSKNVGISAGVVLYSEENKDVSINTLVEIAAKKVLEAKQQGGRRAIL